MDFNIKVQLPEGVQPQKVIALKMTKLQLLQISQMVPVNNTSVVTSAGCVHAASCWPCDSLPVSLYITK